MTIMNETLIITIISYNSKAILSISIISSLSTLVNITIHFNFLSYNETLYYY